MGTRSLPGQAGERRGGRVGSDSGSTARCLWGTELHPRSCLRVGTYLPPMSVARLDEGDV